MEHSFDDSLAYKNVKTVAVVFIILSSLQIFSKLIGLFSLFLFDSFKEYADTMEFQEFNIDMSVNVQLALKTLTIIISVFILIYSISLLKYKDSARKGLITSLIVCIIYLLILPILTTYVFPEAKTNSMFNSFFESMKDFILFVSYFWAIGISVGFIFVIRFLNKASVKQICN